MKFYRTRTPRNLIICQYNQQQGQKPFCSQIFLSQILLPSIEKKICLSRQLFHFLIHKKSDSAENEVEIAMTQSDNNSRLIVQIIFFLLILIFLPDGFERQVSYHSFPILIEKIIGRNFFDGHSGTFFVVWSKNDKKSPIGPWRYLSKCNDG